MPDEERIYHAAGAEPGSDAIFDNPYRRADGQLKVSQPQGGWRRIPAS